MLKMPKANQIEFDAILSVHYFKSNEQAAKFVREIEVFPNALGMDESSGGFLALHRSHSMSALKQEIPAALVLKRLGHRVILLEETKYALCPDAQIDGLVFEIKRISRTQKIPSAVLHQFRTAYRKSPHLLLHIDQTVKLESLRTALFAAFHRYRSVRQVWLIVGERLWQLHREVVLKGDFRLK